MLELKYNTDLVEFCLPLQWLRLIRVQSFFHRGLMRSQRDFLLHMEGVPPHDHLRVFKIKLIDG